jgi:hypothetical protein
LLLLLLLLATVRILSVTNPTKLQLLSLWAFWRDYQIASFFRADEKDAMLSRADMLL